MPSGEVQTDEIVRHALSSGKDVFVPYLYKNEEGTKEDGELAPRKIMDMVRLKGLEDYERLERDSWGIPTVTEDTVGGRERILGGSEKDGKVQLSNGLDLVLMPGVAFDLEGQPAVIRRLGHGKGFYDYFLYQYRSHYHLGLIENAPERPPLQEFGLALEEQFLQDKNLSVPMGPHDSILAGLIIGSGEVLKSITFAS
jgi:5-formyltetrahydrofolate cyclo-ligase